MALKSPTTDTAPAGSVAGSTKVTRTAPLRVGLATLINYPLPSGTSPAEALVLALAQGTPGLRMQHSCVTFMSCGKQLSKRTGAADPLPRPVGRTPEGIQAHADHPRHRCYPRASCASWLRVPTVMPKGLASPVAPPAKAVPHRLWQVAAALAAG